VEAYLKNASMIRKQRKELSVQGQKLRCVDPKIELYNSQNGRCEYCNQVFDNFQETLFDSELSGCEIHHVIPLSSNGGSSKANLSLLHQNCHRLLHQIVGKNGIYVLKYRYKNKNGSKF